MRASSPRKRTRRRQRFWQHCEASLIMNMAKLNRPILSLPGKSRSTAASHASSLVEGSRGVSSSNAPHASSPVDPEPVDPEPVEGSPPAAAHRARATDRAAAKTWLRSTFPALFSSPLPIALGLGREIVALAIASGYSKKAINDAMHAHVTRPQYFEALAAEGAMRHGLDGCVIEPVGHEHRAQALEDIKKRLACPGSNKSGNASSTKRPF